MPDVDDVSIRRYDPTINSNEIYEIRKKLKSWTCLVLFFKSILVRMRKNVTESYLGNRSSLRREFSTTLTYYSCLQNKRRGRV